MNTTEKTNRLKKRLEKATSTLRDLRFYRARCIQNGYLDRARESELAISYYENKVSHLRDSLTGSPRTDCLLGTVFTKADIQARLCIV